MPTIQNSIGAPAAVRGAPWRASVSRRASASAASSVVSASAVIAPVTAASGAACSTSSVARRSSTSWRVMRSAAGRPPWPSRCRRSINAAMTGPSGTPGASSASWLAWRRRTRCTKRLCSARAAGGVLALSIVTSCDTVALC
jgi:hypothetical protein